MIIEKLEKILEWGGTKREIAFLIIAGTALLASLLGWEPFPFPIAWIAIILCGIPIILEAVIGLVTAFDIKADVLVSLALACFSVDRGRFCRRRSGLYYAAWRPFRGSYCGKGKGWH